eukprot:COSAG02_NODE_340_length_24179_cov_6.401644_13_plen_108_part_00
MSIKVRSRPVFGVFDTDPDISAISTGTIQIYYNPLVFHWIYLGSTNGRSEFIETLWGLVQFCTRTYRTVLRYWYCTAILKCTVLYLYCILYDVEWQNLPSDLEKSRG